jgi:enoyl-CoA hydratase/carnithine racemase
MAEGLVLAERAPEGYAVLTLNRPEAMNALSAALRRALAKAFTELAAEPSLGVLILTGAGRGGGTAAPARSARDKAAAPGNLFRCNRAPPKRYPAGTRGGRVPGRSRSIGRTRSTQGGTR